MIDIKIFLDELRKHHKAKITSLLHRHKAAIGYLILAIGTSIALFFSFESINIANDRAERQSAVICESVTRQDKQTLVNLHTKIDKELIRSLRISPDELRFLIYIQLKRSADERKALQPSNPKSSCSSKITTLIEK